MAGGGAASSAACSRARVLKLLLVVLGAVVFLEYVSGLLMEGGRTLTLYASNSSTMRNSQGLPWPKRTHGRHCFDDHVSGPGTQLEPFSASNATPTFLSPTRMPANLTSDERNPVINVHNSTLRAKIFIDEKNSSQSDADSIANRTTTLGDLNTNNSWTTMMTDERVSTESPEAGCEFPCPAFPPGLEGPIAANLTDINLKDLEFSHLDVEEGGRFAPRTCKPKYKVAIIIPYRDRESHLAIFLNNIHPFLMKQQIDYQIFIVEQKGSAKFNRATLMNVGFVESMRLRAWDCFVFHDVDLIPLDDRNLYTCPQQPRHLSAAIDKFEFKLPYRTIFGGVSSLTSQQFKKVNGFSNSFWGWGGEDDDMASRIGYHQFHISRYPMSIARYTMLDHEKEKPNQERYNVLIKGKQLYNTDGLNNLHYKLMDTRMHALYTQLIVELQPPS